MSRRVEDNAARGRYELFVDDELAGFAEYLPAGDSVIIAHTEVAQGQEGQGFGGAIVRATLEHVDAQGKTVLPTCPFASAYIKKHPELVRYVAPSLRGQFPAG